MTTYIVTVEDGMTTWRNTDGQLHRDDGPATISEDCIKTWYQHGKMHRDDGPAMKIKGGTKIWYQHGKIHRTDGPAIEYSYGDKDWYLNGIKLSESEFNQQIRGVGKIIVVDGMKYQALPT
jgi:hypothetical protein